MNRTEKEASRKADEEVIKNKTKTPEELRSENGKFAFPDAIVDLDSAKRLW